MQNRQNLYWVDDESVSQQDIEWLVEDVNSILGVAGHLELVPICGANASGRFIEEHMAKFINSPIDVLLLDLRMSLPERYWMSLKGKATGDLGNHAGVYILSRLSLGVSSAEQKKLANRVQNISQYINVRELFSNYSMRLLRHLDEEEASVFKDFLQYVRPSQHKGVMSPNEFVLWLEEVRRGLE